MGSRSYPAKGMFNMNNFPPLRLKGFNKSEPDFERFFKALIGLVYSSSKKQRVSYFKRD
jgi:hypothetical protein